MTGTNRDEPNAATNTEFDDLDELCQPIELPDGDHIGNAEDPGDRAPAATATHRRARDRKRAFAALGTVVLIPVLFMMWSIAGALTTPGNYSFKAKWADWLRSHGAGFIVDDLENAYFKSHEPHKGGTLVALHHLPGAGEPGTTGPPTGGPTSTVGQSAPSLPPHLNPPGPVPLVVSPAVAGEGQWLPIGPRIDGLPGMYVAQFRADDIYTSQITSAVWIDPELLRIRFMAGSQEPAGAPPGPHAIVGDARSAIAAAFNGGFRFQDAKGGVYVDGQEVIPLVQGAASVVIHKDGRIELGAWGREVAMSDSVESVLQNLTLMVDNGQLDSRVSHNDTSTWGHTLKGAIVTARSGIGITADGALVYVAGPALTAKSLAESLQRAGAVRAMTLDINPEWVTFLFYSHPRPDDPNVVVGAKLYPGIQRPDDRYLSPDSRDFFTVSTR